MADGADRRRCATRLGKSVLIDEGLPVAASLARVVSSGSTLAWRSFRQERPVGAGLPPAIYLTKTWTLCLKRHKVDLHGGGVAEGAAEGRIQSKPVRWVGSCLEDLKAFPEDVRRRIGGALWDAQQGQKAPFAKPLKGYQGAGVLEVVDDFDGDTYRAVYTVRFAGVVYVLHAFQKKSKHGMGTPKTVLDLIDKRLKRAHEDYEQWSKGQNLTFR